jgi:hypothetical protein
MAMDDSVKDIYNKRASIHKIYQKWRRENSRIHTKKYERYLQRQAIKFLRDVDAHAISL